MTPPEQNPAAASVDTFVAVPGGRLHVLATGEGPPVLLVHSAIVDLRAWDDVVPALVRAGYRVVRYDLRGFGDSTTTDVEFSHVADALAVLDSVGARKAALVGNSRGGMIALDTTIESPDRVAALVWVAGGISGFDGPTPTSAELELYEEGDRLFGAGDLDGLTDLDVRVWVDGVGQAASRVPSVLREAVRAMARPIHEPGRVFGRPTSLDPPALARLSEVHIPTLAIVGSLDESETQAAAIRLADTVPGARLEVVPDVAHLVGIEAPTQLAALIADFLAPIPRWD